MTWRACYIRRAMYTLKATLVLACLTVAARAATPPAVPPVMLQADPREKHLRNIRQLTDGGSNAECYWSADGQWLTFQSTRGTDACDQIYRMRADGSDVQRISHGGRTTCSYWLPDGKRIVYASTHRASMDCPPVPDRSKGYVWPLFAAYDLFSVKPDGTDLQQLTDSPGYDAEATASPDGKHLVFTSTRDGDLELYSCDVDGKHPRRLTTTPGYDGGAFYSPDSSKIVYRSFHPETATELLAYKKDLADGLYRPTWLELMVMNADGSNQHQVTHLKAASFCPFFYPSGKRIIFASNHGAAKPFQFDLWAVNEDGTDLERITYTGNFDGFPMFSPDGKRIVWGSNRRSTGRHQTNIFVADWVP